MTAVTVLGAGVIGLSTALELQKRGHTVTIVTEYQPTDAKSIKYTSPWAGAHHVTFAIDDEKQLEMDKKTFQKMWELSGMDETQHLFMRLQQEECSTLPPRGPESVHKFYPGFAEMKPESLPPKAKTGATFQTITIDVPNYLLYLLEVFQKKGGRVIRASVQHIQQLIDGGFGTGKPDAVVICAGIGARTLGGLEDKDVYPIRGQTVLMRTPWVKFGKTLSSNDVWTYIIPRRSGDVIVGGIKTENDWYPHPLPEITEDILTRALELCPELAPQEIRSSRAPTIEDLKPLIIEECCGLRPGRVGGIRLESVHMPNRYGKEVPVVFNYGHGGYGYQSSWGSASIAADLLVAALKGVFTVAR